MTYVTNTDIQERLGASAYIQLADDNGDGVADVGVVDEVRLAAEGEVNSHLARRYAMPIDLALHADLADVLASVTLDLAEYRLRLRRPPLPDDARRRYEQTLRWLEGLADGTLQLPSATPPASSAARGPIAAVLGEDRVLTRREMEAH